MLSNLLLEAAPAGPEVSVLVASVRTHGVHNVLDHQCAPVSHQARTHGPACTQADSVHKLAHTT